MPENVSDAIAALEEIAATDTEWRPFQQAVPALRERAGWLHRQWDLIPSPLVVVLFGGTGTGKSTLLNALAGAPVAETGPTRPTTEQATVYHPAGAVPQLGAANYVARGDLEDLVLVDLPDTDSIRLDHRERVGQLLAHADVVLFCGTQQKYKDEQSIALLRPYQHEHKMVCVQTRADEDADICPDWLRWLRQEGFSVDRCYRVSAIRAFIRKSRGAPAGDEFDFAELEAYLRDKLPPERAEIKMRNLCGAVARTVEKLLRALHDKEQALADLDVRLADLEARVTQTTMDELQGRLMNEPHVWIVALGDAVSERAFGLLGLLYRILHGLRMFPSRITGRFTLAGLIQSPATTGKHSGQTSKTMPDDAYLRQVSAGFRKEHAEAMAHMSRAGFPVTEFEAWQEEVAGELKTRLAQYLEPIQCRLERRARRMTAWLLPILEALWLIPLVFTLGVPVFDYYWNLIRYGRIVLPQPGLLSQALGMIGVILVFELAVFAWMVRVSGRGLRKKLRKEILRGMNHTFGFGRQRESVKTAAGLIDAIRRAGSLPPCE